VSRTPFIPTRHPKVTRAGVAKRDETGSADRQPGARAEKAAWAERPSRACGSRAVQGTDLGGREVPWAQFACRRANGEGRRAAYDRGYGFLIEFPEAVQGPVAVGYASHFGNGGI